MSVPYPSQLLILALGENSLAFPLKLKSFGDLHSLRIKKRKEIFTPSSQISLTTKVTFFLLSFGAVKCEASSNVDFEWNSEKIPLALRATQNAYMYIHKENFCAHVHVIETNHGLHFQTETFEKNFERSHIKNELTKSGYFKLSYLDVPNSTHLTQN